MGGLPESLKNGLVLDLPFTEGSGTKIRDKSNQTNHGTISGDATWISGRGLALDGVDEFITTAAAVLPSTGEFTAAVLASRDTIKVQTWFAQWSAGSTGRLDCALDSQDRMLISLGGGTAVIGNRVVGSGVHTFIISRKDGVITIYLDGKKESSGAGAAALDVVAAKIGTYGTGQYWDGNIYQSECWNRQLSEEEVRQVHQMMINAIDPLWNGLILDLPLNEGSGVKAFDNTANAKHGAFGAGAAAPTWLVPNGCYFDGGDEINFGDQSVHNPTAITMMAVFTPTDMTTQDIFSLISKGVQGSNTEYWLRYDNRNGIQKWYGEVGNGTTRVAANYAHIPVVGTKYVFAATYDKLMVRLYLNGKLVGTGVLTGDLLVGAMNLYIGRYSGGASYKCIGNIHKARIWSRALSESEVRRLYEMEAN